LSYFDTVAGSMVANSRTTATTVMSQTYDAMGHVLTETDALTNIVTHSYDELGRVKQTIEPLRAWPVRECGPFKGAPIAPATNFVYNGFGQLVQQTRGALITKMAYDFGGNLISVTDPNASMARVTRRGCR